ncbi:MAG: hypothetical protein KAI83_11780 [Thiomargarita sp.]|nr:hypothetical protein [Thiomargarita sp.]
MKKYVPIFFVSISMISSLGCVSSLSKKESSPPSQATVSTSPGTAPLHQVPASFPQTQPLPSATQPVPGDSGTAVSPPPATQPAVPSGFGTAPEQEPADIAVEVHFEPLPSKPLLEPMQVVEAYYQAISDKNCGKAAQLRPGYTEQSCYNIESMTLKEAKKLWEKGETSVVYIDILYKKGGKEKSFFGYVKLIKRPGQWLIVNNSYQSGSKMDFDEYLRVHKLS